MPHLGVGDRVKETTTTTGTGTINLGGAETGFQTFVDGIGNGHETYYVIAHQSANEWEVGYGTITDAATDTLSRTTVLSSSNAGSLVNFSAGTKDVFCSLPSEKAVLIDGEANISVTANMTATSFAGSGASLTSLNATNVASGTLPNARLDQQLQDVAGLTPTSGKFIQGDGANFTISAYTIPTADGTSGQVLTTNGSGAVTFQTPTVGDITAVTAGSGLTGGGTSGDVTLNVGAGTGVTVGADTVSIGQDVATSASPTFAGGTFTANVALGDSDFINLGASSDLQIGHNHVTGVSSITDINVGGTLNLAGDTVKLTGTTNVNSAYTLPTSDGTSGQVLTTNGAGALTFATPTVGDITAVTAGNGLTGGGTSGDVTLNVGAGTGVTVGADTVSIGQDVATSASPTFAGATFTANVSLGDNDYINFGASNDLYIGHNGTDSFIRDQGAGDLYIDGATNINLRKAGTTELLARFTADAAAELYYDNVKKFETTSAGATVNGALTTTSTITSSSGTSSFDTINISGELNLTATGTENIIDFAGTEARLRWLNSSPAFENIFRALNNGAVELYHNGSKKFETTASGATLTGTLTTDGVSLGDNENIQLGASGDLRMFHDGVGGNSYIQDAGTGDLYIDAATNLNLRQYGTSELYAKFVANGAAEIYYDNSKKLETTSTGVTVTGSLNVTGGIALGTNMSFQDNEKALFGTSDDLEIFHDGSNSYIRDVGTGDLRISADNNVDIQNSSGTKTSIRCQAAGAVNLYYDNSNKLQTTSSGINVTGTVTETSSIEYKENVQPLEFNEAIYNVNAVKYDRKDGSAKDEVGVIAEELYEILPDLVQTKEGKPDSVKYTKLTMYLLEALKKQNQEIQELKKRLN